MVCTIDINECASYNGLGTCQQICTNTPGSYYCGCYAGYTLAADSHHCNGEDISVCTHIFDDVCDQ